MILEKLIVGMLATNCYIFGSEKSKEVVIIDPGEEPDRIKTIVDNNSLIPIAILLTHGHFDHTRAMRALIRTYRIPLMYNEKDKRIVKKEASRWLNEGDIVKVGELNLYVLETPGHSPGSVCFYTKDVKFYKNLPVEGILFSGDLIFRRSIGRSDFEGGNQRLLFESIRNKIMYNKDLSDNFIIFPGHMGNTTIGEERTMNLFKNYFL